MGTPLSRASGPTVRIRVAFVGGGPAGLITAINLIEWAISCESKIAFMLLSLTSVTENRYHHNGEWFMKARDVYLLLP